MLERKNLPTTVRVPYTQGPECPMCHRTIVLVADVKIEYISLRITGGDMFSSNMAATASCEVIGINAIHDCTPGVKR